MKKLINEKISETQTLYTNDHYIKDKYIYCKTLVKDYIIYHIFRVEKILSNYPIRYGVNRYYYLCVPKSNDIKAFVYDNKNVIDIPSNTILYNMSYDEFLATYRSFINCDAKYPNELPDKIIKDYVI